MEHRPHQKGASIAKDIQISDIHRCHSRKNGKSEHEALQERVSGSLIWTPGSLTE